MALATLVPMLASDEKRCAATTNKKTGLAELRRVSVGNRASLCQVLDKSKEENKEIVIPKSAAEVNKEVSVVHELHGQVGGSNLRSIPYTHSGAFDKLDDCLKFINDQCETDFSTKPWDAGEWINQHTILGSAAVKNTVCCCLNVKGEWASCTPAVTKSGTLLLSTNILYESLFKFYESAEH